MAGEHLTEMPLAEVLTSRDEAPSLDDVLEGRVPLVAKVRFGDGGIELRPDGATRTDLILARPGDLLVSGINALKGAVALLPRDGVPLAATVHYGAYKINDGRVIPEYLWHYLRSGAFVRRATTQLPNGIKTELKANRLLGITVSIPDKPGQAAVLERLLKARTLTGQVEKTRRQASEMVLGRRVSVAVDARKLLRSRLGDMEAQFRSMDAYGALGDVLVGKLRHGPSFPCSADADGVAVLMPSSTTGFGLDTSKVEFAVGEPPLVDADYLEPGDIIFARGNKPEQVGNCGLYEGEPRVMTFANLFMRIRVDVTRYEPQFVQYWLMTPMVREHVRKNTKGTGPSIQKINGTGVRSIPFPAGAPRELQTRWVEHLDAVALLSARLEERIGYQVTELQRLQRRITSDAFGA